MGLTKFLLPLFLIISVTCFGDDYRKGYYIQQQDTLRGFIKIDKQLKIVKFKESLSLPYPKLLEPHNISGFTIENIEIFIALKTFKVGHHYRPIFIQMILKGYVTLYRGYFEDSAVFFVQKKDGDIRKIDRKYAKQFLSAYFSDCVELEDKIFSTKKKLVYSKSKMTELVSNYNRCQSHNTQ
ncbi:MAG: hypothetical protein O7F74_12640 [Bacteroidetes bacterium]|nr:hypothetical protein [Bacteroidota bacterium]